MPNIPVIRELRAGRPMQMHQRSVQEPFMRFFGLVDAAEQEGSIYTLFDLKGPGL